MYSFKWGSFSQIILAGSRWQKHNQDKALTGELQTEPVDQNPQRLPPSLCFKYNSEGIVVWNVESINLNSCRVKILSAARTDNQAWVGLKKNL